MFVIAGVTGNTGGVVAKTLLDEGQKVRVIVRSADKAAAYKALGAEVFVGGLEEPLELARALSGASGLYWLVPPDLTHPAQIARGRRLTEVLVELEPEVEERDDAIRSRRSEPRARTRVPCSAATGRPAP